MGGIRNNSWRYVRTAQTACFKSHEGDLPWKITAERRFVLGLFTLKKAQKGAGYSSFIAPFQFMIRCLTFALYITDTNHFFWLNVSKCFGCSATVCWLCVPIRRPQVPSLFNKTSFCLQEMWVGNERFHIALFSSSLNAVYRELLKPHSISIRAC